MSEFCVVLCTCPDAQSAADIARQCVQSQLAACVQVSAPVSAYYQWDGELCCDTEVQLVLKTSTALLDALYQQVTALHPYTAPQWLVLNVSDGSDTYLNWMRSNLK